MASRCFTCCFPSSRLGGGSVILPGTSSSCAAANATTSRTNPMTVPISTRSVDTQSTESNDTQSPTTELPPLPFSGTTPKGSGSTFYASDDLMTVSNASRTSRQGLLCILLQPQVTVHLSTDGIEEELDRLEEEKEGSVLLEGREGPSATMKVIDGTVIGKKS